MQQRFTKVPYLILLIQSRVHIVITLDLRYDGCTLQSHHIDSV